MSRERRAPPGPDGRLAPVRRLLGDLSGGGLAAVIGLASCCSFAAMVFSGPFAADLGRGITVMLLTAVVVGLVLALRSGFPHAIGGPDNNATALLAVISASLAPAAEALPPDQRFAFLMTVLAVASLAVGLALLASGWRRLARIIRFVPFPVAGGFMAATGWLVVAGALRVATGVPPSWAGLSLYLDHGHLTELAVAAAIAGLGGLAARRWPSPFVLPVVLGLAVLAIHGGLALAGVSVDEARGLGILLDGAAGGAWWTPLDYHPAALRPEVLWQVAGNVAALTVVVTLAILMNGTGVELDSRIEADLDRELRTHGLAGLLSAALGGVAGNMSLSRSTLNRSAGGSGRLSGLTVVVVLGGVLIFGRDLIGLLPRAVLAGLLAHAGLRLMWSWAVAAGRHLPWGDRLTIVAIVVLAANFGFLPALAFGVLAGCVIFVLDISRVGIIRHVFGADEFPSTLMRDDAEMAVLARRGGRVQVVVLCSFIFFGSAYRLYERVRDLIAAKAPRMVIFDLSQVTGVDSSAGAGFRKIAEALREAGARQVIAGGSEDVLRRLRASGGLDSRAWHFATLDQALEQAENAVIAEADLAAGPSDDLVAWLGKALRDTAKARRLAGCLQRVALGAGSYLCHAGDPTDAMHVVESGRISVLLERPDTPPLRVRGIGRHAVVGEMGFFLDQPRSAALRADQDSVLWALDRAAWDRLEAEAPQVVSALQAYLVRLQSERLAFANRQIAALQR
jgi:SulP family sulfate permease